MSLHLIISYLCILLGLDSSAKINLRASKRSLDLYKQTLRYSSASGGESQTEQDYEDEVKEEELWWNGEAPVTDGNIKAVSPSRKAVSGDLTRSLSNPRVASTRYIMLTC